MTLNDVRRLARNGKPRANESVRTLLWVGMPKAGTIQKKYRRGVTLFEVLIVVAIMALIASGVAVGVFKYWIGAQESAAKTSARSLRAAVKTWWVTHDSSTCPQVGELASDGTLDKDSPSRDPWGGEWRIECAGDDVTISSSGRDHKAGTEDDIRVPPT